MNEANTMTEEWLQQLDGLRPLARRLIRDESRADDAVQRVLLKAMTSGGLPKASGFWVRVLRNEVIDEQRAERTRGHHEERASRDSTAPSAHDVVSEAESHNLVSNAVLALEEPYRTIILLRYFKGLKVRQIAAEVDRPMGTVQSQLDRGLELLRGRLSRELGDGRALALALLPLASGKASLVGTPAVSFSLVLVPLVMKFAWIIPLAILGLLGAVFWMNEPEALPNSSAGTVATTEALASLELHEAASLHSASRKEQPRVVLGNEQELVDEASSSLEAASRGEDAIPGLALSVRGRPLANTEIEVGNKVQDPRPVRTDESGGFKYQASGGVRALDEAWLLVASKETPTLGEFVFAPIVQFSGQIVDEVGVPLPQVSLLDTGHLPQSGLDPTEGWTTAASSFNSPSEHGRFNLEGVATWPGRTVTFKHPVFGEHTVPVPNSDLVDATIVFPGATAGYELVVRVVDGSGTPAPDAAVAFGHGTAAVDSEGYVSFPVDVSTGGSSVTAIRSGFLAAHMPAPTLAKARKEPGARAITLTVAQRVAPIEGVVVDADGAPVPGAKVQAWNGPAARDGRTFAAVYVEDGQVRHRSIITDGQGRFTLPRSLAGEVQIRAAAGKPLRMGQAVSRGEPVRIALPTAESRSDVRGRVTDFNGEPVGNARVSVIARLHFAVDESRIQWKNALRSPELTTDAEGGFELLGVGGTELEVMAAYRSDRAFVSLAPGSPDLVVQLNLSCEVELSIDAAPKGASLTVVDAHGAPLPCQRHYGSFSMAWRSEERIPTQGATLTLTVPQSAREARLVVDGEIVRSAILKPSRSRTVAASL